MQRPEDKENSSTLTDMTVHSEIRLKNTNKTSLVNIFFVLLKNVVIKRGDPDVMRLVIVFLVLVTLSTDHVILDVLTVGLEKPVRCLNKVSQTEPS